MRNGCLVVFALPTLRVNELASERVDWLSTILPAKQTVPWLAGVLADNGDNYRHDQDNAPKECMPVSLSASDASSSALQICSPLRHHVNSRLRDEATTNLS